jgi:Fumarate reductase flavoprotein C-term
VPMRIGPGAQLNQELEKAGRVSDFIDLGELMCIDALDRDEPLTFTAVPLETRNYQTR